MENPPSRLAAPSCHHPSPHFGLTDSCSLLKLEILRRLDWHPSRDLALCLCTLDWPSRQLRPDPRPKLLSSRSTQRPSYRLHPSISSPLLHTRTSSIRLRRRLHFRPRGTSHGGLRIGIRPVPPPSYRFHIQHPFLASLLASEPPAHTPFSHCWLHLPYLVFYQNRALGHFSSRPSLFSHCPSLHPRRLQLAPPPSLPPFSPDYFFEPIPRHSHHRDRSISPPLASSNPPLPLHLIPAYRKTPRPRSLCLFQLRISL